MQFLVLGAGYVGQSLLTRGLSTPCTFLASTTSQVKIESLDLLAKEVFLFTGKEIDKLSAALEASDAVGVFVAPNTSFARNSYQDTYLETANILAKTLKGRKKPLHLIYTSSTFVYENSSDGLEDSILHPSQEKANILLQTEKAYLNCQNEYISTCILRLGGIYGPGRELEERAKKVSGKTLEGSGQEPTNHIHLEDILSAIEFCITRPLKGIYNLVNDDHTTRNDLYRHLSTSLHIPPPKWNPETRPTHGCNLAISNQKIKNEGFIFKHPVCYRSD